jgi:hypothetical protein
LAYIMPTMIDVYYIENYIQQYIPQVGPEIIRQKYINNIRINFLYNFDESRLSQCY